MEQKLALAARGVVVPGALEVLGDVRTLEPGLAAVVDLDPRLGQRGPPHPQGLDLGPRQRQARLVAVLDKVALVDEVVLFVGSAGGVRAYVMDCGYSGDLLDLL